MLVTLMYHRITQTPVPSRGIEAFARHLSLLSQQTIVVVPGDKLVRNRINICLTFDDAYFDFYHCVFPLLQQLNIRAVLAIPAGLILDDTDFPVQTRLDVPYSEAMDAYKTRATLCTWNEIREMVASGLVIPACHGLTHQKITQQNLEQEVVYAKQLLEQQLQMTVDTFVYPYGRMTRSINQAVNQHYRYAMRIGSALNLNWKNCHNVIYRANGDELWSEDKPLFTLPHQLYLWARFLSNTLRFK